jgi:hypothetical protein
VTELGQGEKSISYIIHLFILLGKKGLDDVDVLRQGYLRPGSKTKEKRYTPWIDYLLHIEDQPIGKSSC